MRISTLRLQITLHEKIIHLGRSRIDGASIASNPPNGRRDHCLAHGKRLRDAMLAYRDTLGVPMAPTVI